MLIPQAIVQQSSSVVVPLGILPFSPITTWLSGNALQTAGDVQYNAFYVNVKTTITHVILTHNALGGNIDVGIYNDSSGPVSKLASSGSVAAADFVALSSPINLDPGKYWVAVSGDNSGRRLYFHTTLAAPNSTTKIWYSETGQFPLPATAAASAVTHTVIYGIFAASFP